MLDLWKLLTRMQVTYNRTYEGHRPRVQLVVRFGSYNQATCAARTVGCGRVRDGSWIIEGQSLIDAFEALGCKDSVLLDACRGLESELAAQAPLEKVRDWSTRVWVAYNKATRDPDSAP